MRHSQPLDTGSIEVGDTGSVEVAMPLLEVVVSRKPLGMRLLELAQVLAK